MRKKRVLQNHFLLAGVCQIWEFKSLQLPNPVSCFEEISISQHPSLFI